MALTYEIEHSTGEKLIFVRKRSYITTVVAVLGGLIFSFGSLAIPFLTLKILAVSGGIIFIIASIYLPSFNDRFTPNQIRFDSVMGRLAIEMANEKGIQLALNEIKEAIIEVEKRSPSAANSAGIHYLHHHINLKRINGATFNVTSTTDIQEAEQTCNQLNRLLGLDKKPFDKIEYLPCNKIQIASKQPLEIQWDSNRNRLSIGKQVKYSEHNLKGGLESSKEFPLSSFSHVAYSYASTIQNRNFSVYLHYNQQEPARLGLFLKDLNPVECLQFELWLNNQLNERKKALV